jgi:hypothetical protein
MKAKGDKIYRPDRHRDNASSAPEVVQGRRKKQNRLTDHGQRMTQNYRKSPSFLEEES